MNRTNNFTTDGSEWELSKENVQPIKQGRKIPNLMVALSSSTGEDAHWKLQRDKKNFEAEIRTYDGDDPLDVWYRYILWIEENLPKGGRDISTLLERCIKEFKDVDKYIGDERYLYVWLKYANCCSDPLEIYNYMYSQKISSTHSQFYIAWASACENVESYKKADEIIVLGIERKAKPEDILKKYHIGFQHRLTSHIAASDDDSQPCETLENTRTTLGELKTSKLKNTGVMRASNVRKAVRGVNRSNVLGTSQSKGPSFMVHHDDSENIQPTLPTGSGSWKEPPTQSTMTKENELLPGKWTNNDKPSNRRGNLPLVQPAPTKQSFQIHVEENAVQTGYVAQHSIGNQVLTTRKPEQADSNDPLKVITQDQSDGHAKSKVMYDKNKVYTGTEEFQFEEIRAAKYSALMRQGLPLPQEIRRLKREQECQENDGEKEKREKVMYPKEQVYAFEGEFQPEEIMARKYYKQGRRLRPKRKKKELKRERVEIFDENVDTSRRRRMEIGSSLEEQIPLTEQKVKVFGENINTSRDSSLQQNVSLTEQKVNVFEENANTSRRERVEMPSSLGAPKTEQKLYVFDENVHAFGNEEIGICNELVTKGPLTAQKMKVFDENVNISRRGRGDISGSLEEKEPMRLQGVKMFDENVNTSRREGVNIHNKIGKQRPITEQSQSSRALRTSEDHVKETFENVIKDESEEYPVVTTPREALKEVSRPSEHGINEPSSTVCPKAGERTPRLYKDQFVSSLAAPSPTLTTQQAFAEVMPWFNTTVGTNDSDAEFEAQFKNDSNVESNDDMFAVAFGGEIDIPKVKNEPNEMYPFHDDDEDEVKENIPPVGCPEPPKNTREMAGILQAALNIEVEPLEDECDDEDDVKFKQDDTEDFGTMATNNMPIKYEKLKDDEEITQFQGLNHSQFAATARLASTPFGEQGDPRLLPTFHCSTIRQYGGNDENEDVTPAQKPPISDQKQPTPPNICASPFSTPSKVLSPIFECSDEDGKTSSSSSGASSHSSTNTKSTVTSRHNHSEVVPTDTPGDGDSSRHERSLDITVHNANGDILQIVNPFDPVICRNLLSTLSVPITAYPGYHDLKHEILPKMAPQKKIGLGSELYTVGKIIGTGAFGKVYSANSSNKSSAAIKIQAPANEWEFYVCSELVKRLRTLGKSEQEISMVVKIDDFYLFDDGSCCVSKYHKRGTFLDLINYYKTKGTVKEHIASYYAMELMKILECIHECGIIHGDVKPDNLLLIGNNISAERTEPGLALIDLGCSIDCTLFPVGTRFSVGTNTESFECIEMKTGRPWTTQVDTYGMLCSLHCLIFGKYMNVYKDPKTLRWRAINIVPRMWHKVLWTKFFDVFLNIPSCDELPSIRKMLVAFEEHFNRKLKQGFASHIEQQNQFFGSDV